MTKLQSVYFIKEMITSCTGCSYRLKVYKLEATYRNIENSKITANLMTDVLFCERCARGYLLEAFRITIDQHGKRWIALETAAPVKEGLRINSPATVSAPEIPNGDRITVREIHHNLSKGAKCTTCKRVLIKKKIILMIKTCDGQRELEERTRAFYCSVCSKWSLKLDTYATIKIKYKAHIIPVKTISITGVNQLKPIKSKKTLPKSKMTEGDIRTFIGRSTVSSHPVNTSFDRTGRFIHSDATKRWKDYNSD